MLTNNPSKLWNKFIIAARFKPIISILETLRKQVMRRIQEKKEKISKWNGLLCPKITERTGNDDSGKAREQTTAKST